jgi:hypothetical protein
MFENRALRRIFVNIRMSGICRKLHSEELYTLYAPLNAIRPEIQGR